MVLFFYLVLTKDCKKSIFKRKGLYIVLLEVAMLINLAAEIARNQISEKEIASLLGKNFRYIRKRLYEEKGSSGERFQFGTLEIKKIRKIYFPDCTIEYLAESSLDDE